MTPPYKSSAGENPVQSSGEVVREDVKKDVRQKLAALKESVKEIPEAFAQAENALREIEKASDDEVRAIMELLQGINALVPQDPEATTAILTRITDVFETGQNPANANNAEPPSQLDTAFGKFSEIMEKITKMVEELKKHLEKIDADTLNMIEGFFKNSSQTITKALNDAKNTNGALGILILKTLQGKDPKFATDVVDGLRNQILVEATAAKLQKISPPYDLYTHTKAVLNAVKGKGTATVDTLLNAGNRIIEAKIQALPATPPTTTPAAAEVAAVTAIPVAEGRTFALEAGKGSTDKVTVGRASNALTLAANGKTANISTIEGSKVSTIETQAGSAEREAKVLVTLQDGQKISIGAGKILDATKKTDLTLDIPAMKIKDKENDPFNLGVTFTAA